MPTTPPIQASTLRRSRAACPEHRGDRQSGAASSRSPTTWAGRARVTATCSPPPSAPTSLISALRSRNVYLLRTIGNLRLVTDALAWRHPSGTAIRALGVYRRGDSNTGFRNASAANALGLPPCASAPSPQGRVQPAPPPGRTLIPLSCARGE